MIFKVLIRHGGKLSTSEITKITGCSWHTAVRTMNTLRILKLANMEMERKRGGLTHVLVLNDDLATFKNKELRDLLQIKTVKAKKKKELILEEKEEYKKYAYDVLFANSGTEKNGTSHFSAPIKRGRK
jgi:hypothetical protein